MQDHRNYHSAYYQLHLHLNILSLILQSWLLLVLLLLIFLCLTTFLLSHLIVGHYYPIFVNLISPFFVLIMLCYFHSNAFPFLKKFVNVSIFSRKAICLTFFSSFNLRLPKSDKLFRLYSMVSPDTGCSKKLCLKLTL